jgi:alpha-N-arabinofuranosidase
VSAQIAVADMQIGCGRIFELAGDPEYEVIETQPNAVAPVDKTLPQDGRWTFPAASVSAVELDIQPA